VAMGAMRQMLRLYCATIRDVLKKLATSMQWIMRSIHFDMCRSSAGLCSTCLVILHHQLQLVVE